MPFKDRDKQNSCRRKYYRKWYPRRRKELGEIRAKKRRDNIGKYLEMELRQRERIKISPHSKYLMKKSEAKRRNLGFTLTYEKFLGLWQKPCYYCGSQIETIGLDRIDSKLGYTDENVRSCCFRCNSAKSNLTEIEFFELIGRIYKKHIV